MENIVKSIMRFFLRIYHQSSSDRFRGYLIKKGIVVGKGTHFDPKTSVIDISRPSLVTIGDNCYMNRNFTLLTHDWVTNVFIHKGLDFINSSGKVTIGNNVSFGQNVIVLKGVTIGDNSFIGAGSIVSKDIPANCIAVGSPCKPIMAIEEYHKKRVLKSKEEAFEYARSIRERFGRKPIIEDFWEEFPLFISGSEVNKYPNLPIKKQLGSTYEHYITYHKAEYPSFEDFLEAANIK